jgi:flagellar biosynthesis/type III secretory pathway protein FliH
LDEGSYANSELEPLKNLAAALFRLENSRTPQDVEQVLAALIGWLQAPQQSSLRRAFTVWLKRVFLPGRMPGVELHGVDDLQEVRSMLAERVIEWTKQWERQGLEKGLLQGRQEGRQEGHQEGRQEGRQEGEAALLLRQLEYRFGQLDETTRARIRRADAETLLLWGERVLMAASIEDVFEP